MENDSKELADLLLEQIANDMRSLDKVRAEALKKIEAVKLSYAGLIDRLKAAVESHEKALEKLAKMQRVEIFGGKDRVDLDHGALLLTIEKRVVHARGVLAKLEAFEAEGEQWAIDAIKTAKSVDWDAVEKWSQERLIMVGTERKKEERFAYELAGRR